MRTPLYMSPTSLKAYESNKDEYYVKYLADVKPPRLPQTMPMSVGSAFDAYVKSYLHFALFGNYGENNTYAKDTIFEKQVEPANRDWARLAGAHVFERYKQSGALADLMLELGTAINAPRFEFDLLGQVETSVGDVPLMGKPDIYFMNREGGRVIFDWKVNGYCGNSPTSPMRGYVMVRDGWTALEKKQSNNNRSAHKDCYPVPYKGIKINATDKMEDLNAEWAAQLAIYAWLLGEEVGSQDLITGIDQIVGQPSGTTMIHKKTTLAPGELIAGDFNHQIPWLRFASHRVKIGQKFQFELLARLAQAWGAISSGHIFSELNREDNDQRCKMLEDRAAMFADTSDPLFEFANSLRKQ